MPARDMASGEDHHHERRADGERRDHARTTADHGAADREDKKESADEFRDVFFHMLGVGRVLLAVLIVNVSGRHVFFEDQGNYFGL